MENIATGIGQRIVVRTSIASGVNQINSFTNGIVGETAVRFFDKTFRYTLDTINWYDEQPLTNTNLQSIDINQTQEFEVEYIFTRQGTDDTGDLQLDWINLNVDAVDIDSGETFHNSVFSYFFDEINTQPSIVNWCSNVLNKLYQPGIVSKTLTRGANQNLLEEDRDYIDLWRTVSCFFSVQVQYAKQFELFDSDRRLLARYLTTKSLFIQKDQSIDSMIVLMHNFYNQMAKRGTMEIVDVKNTPNSELLRIINYNGKCEEMLFAPNNPRTVGWVVNTNSPLNKYIHDNPFLIKLYTEEQYVNLPLIGQQYVGIEGTQLKIFDVPNDEVAGITLEQFNDQFTTVIDPTITYEMNFWVKGDGNLTATVLGFDDENQPLNPITLGSVSTQSNTAIVRKKMINNQNWFFVRIIVFPHTYSAVVGSVVEKTNIGVGFNMKWKKDTCRAGVQILLDNSQNENENPTATNTFTTINHDAVLTISLQHLINNYSDIEGDTFSSITVTGLVGGGTLILDGNIPNLPFNVTRQQIDDGLLQYDDDESVVEGKQVKIQYDINDESMTGDVGDILYIRDIKFKPLKTTYGKGIVGSPLLVESWLNNKGERSNSQVDEIVRRYLIPHNVAFINNFIKQPNSAIEPIAVNKGLYEDKYETRYQ